VLYRGPASPRPRAVAFSEAHRHEVSPCSSSIPLNPDFGRVDPVLLPSVRHGSSPPTEKRAGASATSRRLAGLHLPRRTRPRPRLRHGCVPRSVRRTLGKSAALRAPSGSDTQAYREPPVSPSTLLPLSGGDSSGEQLRSLRLVPPVTTVLGVHDVVVAVITGVRGEPPLVFQCSHRAEAIGTHIRGHRAQTHGFRRSTGLPPDI